MMTEAPAPADLQPLYVERTFSFRVAAVPDDMNDLYRLEVRCDDPEITETFALYYRKDDFSLARVLRTSEGEPEEVVAENGANPFIYYQRRMPIIPDFPVQLAGEPQGREAEYSVNGKRRTQRTVSTPEGVRITLEQADPSGILRVVMEWSRDKPWWSTIECSENPPSGANLPGHGQVVAKGYLLEGSIVRARR